jgi:hypothetical protein
MRTTIDLPEPLLENAKERALEARVTLSEVVRDALLEHLAKRPVAGASEFRLCTVRGRLVGRGIDLSRTSALVTMDDEAEYQRRGE